MLNIIAQELISEVKFQINDLRHIVAFGDNIFAKVNDPNSTIIVKNQKNLKTHTHTHIFEVLYAAGNFVKLKVASV